MRKTIAAIIVLALVIAALSIQVLGAEPSKPDLKELLTGKAFPLTIKLKDMNSTWVQFSANEKSADKTLTGAYYTKGETVVMGEDTYLVAYNSKEKVTDKTTLSLSLVNINNMGCFGEICPVAVKTQSEPVKMKVAGSVSAWSNIKPAAGNDSISNLRDLTVSLLTYAARNDNTLPMLDNPALVKQALSPFVINKMSFLDPVTKKPYRTNTLLSEHKIAHIKFPMYMVVFFEEKPDASGMRAVALLDGDIRRVTESEWVGLKRLSKID
jgi:hypothetical protein